MREEITFKVASIPVTYAALFFFPDRICGKLVLPAVFPWFQSVTRAKDFAKRKKKKMLGEHQVSRSFSLFLAHRAGLRDVYFRSVCDSWGVSEKQNFLVHRVLVNLSVNKTGGHISRMNYWTRFATSRKPSCQQIDRIRIQIHAFSVFARKGRTQGI